MKLRAALLILLAACHGGAAHRDGGGGDDDDGGGGDDDGMPGDDDAGPTYPDAGPAPFCTPTAGTEMELFPVATGLSDPVAVAAPAGDPRLFIVEQSGTIRVLKNGA